MRTATKIPRWSCSCCATTSLCGPVTRRVMGTSHRKAATTNLPKLKSFLNLIRTSYSLSSPRPPWSAHLYFHPPRFIHPCPPVRSSPRVPRFPSFLSSFQPQISLLLTHLFFSKAKQTDIPPLPPSPFFFLFLSFFIPTWPHTAADATATAVTPSSKKSNVLRVLPVPPTHARPCLFADNGRWKVIWKIKYYIHTHARKIGTSSISRI